MKNIPRINQDVTIEFNYNIQSLKPLHELEERLNNIIKEKQLGEYDGHEIALDYSNGFLYMHGPNAELLFKTIMPTLKQAPFMHGAIATLNFDPSEDNEIEVYI